MGFFQGDDAFDEELQIPANASPLDYLYLELVSPPFQACQENMRLLLPQDSQVILPSASSEILRRCTRSEGNEKPKPEPLSKLLANHIIELAAENFIHSNISHTYATTLSSLSTEEAKDI